MKMTPLLAASLLSVLSVTPLRAQSHDAKDMKKATALAEKDKDFASLPDDEKRAVVLFIAEKIHAQRRRAISANISTLTGKDAEALKKRAAASTIVLAEQDKEAVSIPAESKLEVKSIDTPPFGRLFADNEWTVDEGSTEAATLKQNIDKVVDALKKGDGRLVSMHIESSASTLRNTGKAAKLTHLELSKLRAEAAARYALEYLKAKGVNLDEDEQVTLDYEGANGNGTSGASSPFAAPLGDDPKFSAGGSCEAPDDIKEAAAKGSGMSAQDRAAIAAFYDPNKYVQITFDAVFEVKDTKPGQEVADEAHMVTASIAYKPKPHIKIPPLRIRLPRISLRGIFGNSEKRKAHRAVRCPNFNKKRR